jgi:hypothetical protein
MHVNRVWTSAGDEQQPLQVQSLREED